MTDRDLPEGARMTEPNDDQIRSAHARYLAEPNRSLEEAALDLGTTPERFRARVKRLGLQNKGRHDAKQGKPNMNVANAAASTDEAHEPRARIVRPSVQRMYR